MAIRGPNASAPRVRAAGLCHLHRVLVAGMALQAGACASATVGDVGTHADAAPNGSGTGGNATGGSGGGGTGGTGGAGGTSVSTFGVCDPFTSSGCSSDKKCTALQTGTSLTIGCGSKGNGTEGATCTQTGPASTQTGDDCGAGLACFGTPATCHRLCSPSGTDCPGTEVCNLPGPGLPDTVRFCRAITTCKALEQTGCPSGQACYFASTGAQCATKGAIQPGESCSGANDCDAGSTCIAVGSSRFCSSFCSTASDGTPSCSGASTGGSTCASLGSADEPNLGSCR